MEGQAYRVQTLFVPYRGLLSTNQALKLLRADGFRAGRWRLPGKRMREDYNNQARAMRDAVALSVRAVRWPQPREVVKLSVEFVGCDAWDDDAPLLSVKWIVDGLTDAGLWKKDRRVLTSVTLSVVRESGSDPGFWISLDSGDAS